MGRSFLRLTDSEFWEMSPRTLLSMIDEYNDLKKCEFSWSTFIANGGKVELERDKKREAELDHVFYDPFFC
jgi:hypothetical protein